MKKYLLTLLLCFAALTFFAQANFQVYTKAPDTLNSVFGQNACQTWSTTIPIVLDEMDEPIPAYDVYIKPDPSFLTIQFPGFNRLMVRSHKSLNGIIGRKLIEPLLRERFGDGQFLNLMPLYAEVPGLFDSAKSGTQAVLRYQLLASFDHGTTFEYIYSKPDTIYIPPASSEDIGAFAYLKSKVNSVREFSYLGMTFPDIEDSFCNHLIDNFPNSIIADYARFIKGSNTLNDWIDIHGRGDRQAFINAQDSYYGPLKTSKSSIIQNKALFYFNYVRNN